MSKIITQDKVVLMIQPSGKPGGVGTGLEPMSIDKHGFTGKTDNTIPGQGQIYGRDAYGRFRVKVTFKETPGGLNTGTIEYEKEQSIDYLEQRAKDESKFGAWEMYAPCARLDNPFGWLNGGRLDYRGSMFVTSTSDGDAPVREASGQPVVSSVPVSWEYNLTFLPLALASIAWEDAINSEDITDIAVLVDPNPNNCVAGYRGPDEHIYTCSAEGIADGVVLWSRDGGSIIGTTSADPFTGGTDGLSQIVARLLTNTFRVITARGTTDAAAAAQVAYADVEFGDEGTTVWTQIDVGVTLGDTIVAMEWLFYNRIYVSAGVPASEGEIWLSQDQGETFTQLFDGSTIINGFIKGWGEDCKDVYAFGATNLILRETGLSGSFVALVGPSGGAAFTAAAIANDGLLFAGNGTSLYVSNNYAQNTGGWTELKDFGTLHAVKEVFLPEGDSNHIYVVVDDSTPGDGEFWHSNDGGNSWNQVLELPNPGYNAAYASFEDNNLFYIVGDADASPYGIIHKVSPSAVGC